jgi:hypothetical protein
MKPVDPLERFELPYRERLADQDHRGGGTVIKTRVITAELHPLFG